MRKSIFSKWRLFQTERANDANFGVCVSRGTLVTKAKFGEIRSSRFREMLSSVKSQEKSRWRTSCGPEVGGDVISGGSIEVNKWGVHTKFRGSSSIILL